MLYKKATYILKNNMEYLKIPYRPKAVRIKNGTITTSTKINGKKCTINVYVSRAMESVKHKKFVIDTEMLQYQMQSILIKKFAECGSRKNVREIFKKKNFDKILEEKRIKSKIYRESRKEKKAL